MTEEKKELFVNNWISGNKADCIQTVRHCKKRDLLELIELCEYHGIKRHQIITFMLIVLL